MQQLHLIGGTPLRGDVQVSGAKNAALPIMAASILADGPVQLDNVPHVADVHWLSSVLAELGVEVSPLVAGQLSLQTSDPRLTTADYPLVQRMRASFCVLGPLLARRGAACVALPGGCNLGQRPIDLHLRGLAALGAELRQEGGNIIARAGRLKGAAIDLAGPHGSTVTGTANVLCAAATAEGMTQIRSAAREPEIVALGEFLNHLGADIEGLGGETLIIRGVDTLQGGTFHIMPDRIEAGTLLIAAAATRGEVTVHGARVEHLAALFEVLEQAGAELQVVGGEADAVRLAMSRAPRSLHLRAAPYPGLPTDLQPQLAALLATAEGSSSIRDAVFPSRFLYAAELNRLGADIRQKQECTHIRGVRQLQGAPATATDLRGGAALVIAASAAHGRTVIHQAQHIDRGYEGLDEKLRGLGADVQRYPASVSDRAAYRRRKSCIK